MVKVRNEFGGPLDLEFDDNDSVMIQPGETSRDLTGYEFLSTQVQANIRSGNISPVSYYETRGNTSMYQKWLKSPIEVTAAAKTVHIPFSDGYGSAFVGIIGSGNVKAVIRFYADEARTEKVYEETVHEGTVAGNAGKFVNTITPFGELVFTSTSTGTVTNIVTNTNTNMAPKAIQEVALTGSNVQVLKVLTNTSATWRFWGEEVTTDPTNLGINVSSIPYRKIILKNNTDVTIGGIRVYGFVRDGAGTELYRVQLDLPNLASGSVMTIDPTNFPDIDDAWTHLLLRTQATGRTTGTTDVIYLSRGHL